MPDEIREAIFDTYMDGETRPAKILDRLLDSFPEDQLPVERTVYRIIAEASGRYPDDQRALDQPWLLGPELARGAGAVHHDALPVLIDILKASLMEPALYGTLTVRMARWVSGLAPALKEAGATNAHFTALIYARRERWAVIEGKELETSDLDAWVAFAPWRSDKDLSLYRRAISEGLVPGITSATLLRDVYAGQPGMVQEQLERLAASGERHHKQPTEVRKGG